MLNPSQKPTSRKELIEKISLKLEISKKDVDAVINEYESMILYDLALAHEAKVGIIGKIKIKERAERTAMDLQTNEKVIVPAKIVPKFSFSKGVKEFVANKIK